MHHAVLAAVAASLSLAGCASLDAGIQDQSGRLASICQAEPPIYASLQVVAAIAELDPAITDRARDAHIALTAICRNPPTDTQTALAAALDAYADVTEAQEVAAEAVEEGV